MEVRYGIFLENHGKDHAGELLFQGQIHNGAYLHHQLLRTIYVTDLLLQPGSVATGWVGHPCEMKWVLDG